MCSVMTLEVVALDNALKASTLAGADDIHGLTNGKNLVNTNLVTFRNLRIFNPELT